MENDILTIIGVIILVILSLATLRDVLAKFHLIPAKEGKWWSKILYGDVSKESIINILCKINLHEDDIPLIIEKLKGNNLEKGIIKEVFDEIGVSEIKAKQRLSNNLFDSESISQPNIRLLELILKYIQKGACTFSTNLSISSNYYINSMDASHNNADLNIMSNIIIRLLQQNGFKKLDFILTPKSGNTLLGRDVAEKLNCTSIFCKKQSDNSHVSLEDNSLLTAFVTNFEGVSYLLEKSKSKKTNLNGVIIDCNSSSGDTLKDCMQSFNTNIEALKGLNSDFDNIDIVNSAFVLFRPVNNSTIDIDDKFKNEGFKCVRYLDLCETSKEAIFDYKKRNKKTSYSYYEKDDKELINSIIDSIDKKTTHNKPICRHEG